MQSNLFNRSKNFFSARGITWLPSNKKPEKLRDTLKECEVSTNTYVISHFLDTTIIRKLSCCNVF